MSDALAQYADANGKEITVSAANPMPVTGGSFSPTGGTPAVTTVSVLHSASTALLAANSARKLLIIGNTGPNTVYINLAGGTAVATNLPLPWGSSPLVLSTYVPTCAIT